MSSALQTKHRWTYSDLVALPDDQLRHELIDGEHFVSPSPTTTHQEISKRLFRALDAHAVRHRLGEVLYAPFDINLSAWTVLAPDLVVEILSPGTRRRDLGRKRAVYDRDGAGEYWIVDPEARSITVLRRPRAGAGLTDVTAHTHGDNGMVESPLFPGLKLRLRDVFRPARTTVAPARQR